MIVYISGKITGTNDYVERFNKAEEVLKSRGYNVLNPVRFNGHLPSDSTWSDYMRNCLKCLADADAIYMLKGWGSSKGAAIEYRLAYDLGMQFMYEEDFENDLSEMS